MTNGLSRWGCLVLCAVALATACVDSPEPDESVAQEGIAVRQAVSNPAGEIASETAIVDLRATNEELAVRSPVDESFPADLRLTEGNDYANPADLLAGRAAAEFPACANDPGNYHSTVPDSLTYCSATCQCTLAEGDCDTDGECYQSYCTEAGAVDRCATTACGSGGATHDFRPWSASYCLPACPCLAGEGDCDTNADCVTGNHCSQDVGAAYGQDATMDVCEVNDYPACANDPGVDHTTAPGTLTYCSTACTCNNGEGDCDKSAECTAGTYCHLDVGATYGWDPTTDVCETNPVCANDPGSIHVSGPGAATYCSPTCQCNHAEGDCDTNADCMVGTCMFDVGATYGMPDTWDVCVDACQNGQKDGNETDVDCGGGTCGTCADGKSCLLGIDCTSGACNGGVCGVTPCTNGIKDGSETDVDCGGGTCPDCDVNKTCLHSSDCLSGQCAQTSSTSPRLCLTCHTVQLGKSFYCTTSCRCDMGEGDCDNNANCNTGYVCHQNVGAAYGFAAYIDVCEAP